MYNALKYEIADQVLTLTLNRPDRLNAFSIEMGHELIDAYKRAGADDNIRAIIVTGAGDAFCAGADLNADLDNAFGVDESLTPTMEDLTTRGDDPEIVEKVRDFGGRVSLTVYDCPKPIIAAINGAAVGVGATMTLPMDIRLASEKARIGFVFNKIGIVPEAASSWFLPKLVGMQNALEWCYTGEIMKAEKARASGLVRDVYVSDDLLPAATALARKIAETTSPVAIALTRQMMWRNCAAAHPREAHNVDTLAVFYTSQKDGKEGVKAFLEKRPAKFTQTVGKDMPDFYPWWEE